jgi:glycosyltransferase involved in cell wall biosynthesis
MSGSNSPAVSVLMAAYNVERYIDEAIQSVLSQKGISFEFLIGDDASTDGTWLRIQAYGRDPRVRGWRFSNHQGPASVWNRLVTWARAPYCAICDADDLLLAGHLVATSRFLDRSASVGVVCTPRRYVNAHGSFIRTKRRFISPRETWDLIQMSGAHGGSVFRRKAFRRVGGYRGTAGYADAYDLFLRLAEVTQLALLPGEALYVYRIHSHPPDHYNGHYKHRLESMQMAVRNAILRRYKIEVSW